MSKRNDRRAAERESRKLAYQNRQSPNPQVTEPEPSPAISEAQLTANRANAKLSTGAVTPEGRAKSSMNALKTGLTGKTVLLPHEDVDQYQQALEACIETHKPATEEEHTLVQGILDSNWRLNRIQRLESAILLKGHIEFAGKYEDRTPSERALLIDADAYLKYEKQVRNLNIQEARLRRIINNSRAELARLQTIRRREEKQASQTYPTPKTENGFEFATQSSAPHSSASPQTRTAQQA